MKTTPRVFITVFLILISFVVLFPIIMVFINSFKGSLFISNAPFSMPVFEGNAASYVGLDNYFTGVKKINFFSAFGYSLWITVASVAGILIVSSMLAWYITRVKNKLNSIIYYCLVFSMIVPFQMVMFTVSKMANILHLDNPIGIIVIYIGFGCGMSTFMFAGFIKSIPLAMEEAAMIDGASEGQVNRFIVIPYIKPILKISTIFAVTGSFKSFDLIYVLTNGGPNHATEVPSTLMISMLFKRNRYGMGSTIALLLIILCFAAALIISAIFKERGDDYGTKRKKHSRVSEKKEN